MTKLPFGLRPLLFVTDIGLLTYWSVSALVLFGLINIPGEWLFSDYYDPMIFAWNWSFMPLDVVLSVMGLASARLLARDNELGRGLLIGSMALTFCAGLMAISFWAIRLDFDLSWWAANLFLVIWPLVYFPRVIRMPRVI